MAVLKPAFLIQHPIWSGLFWAALFIPCVALLEFLVMGRLQADLPSFIIRALLAGMAWGFAMRWWHKRRLGALAD
jgi:hypothetical protein